MKVSVITPTYRREAMLPSLYACFAAQSHNELELLVLDDSDTPSAFFGSLADPRVRYSHSPLKLTQGAKRDRLIRASTGDIIVQFDDDDYYSPAYVAAMLDRLGTNDFIKLSGWFLFDSVNRELYYWDTETVFTTHYIVGDGSPRTYAATPTQPAARADWLDRNLWGYGFSYVFRRRIYDAASFDIALNKGQDYPFVSECRRVGVELRAFRDNSGLALHILHGSNMSRSFPNYHLPAFMLEGIFGPGITPYV